MFPISNKSCHEDEKTKDMSVKKLPRRMGRTKTRMPSGTQGAEGLGLLCRTRAQAS